jgi:hypothetical protein
MRRIVRSAPLAACAALLDDQRQAPVSSALGLGDELSRRPESNAK